MPYTPDNFTDFSSTTLAGGAGGLGTSLNPTDTSVILATGTGPKVGSVFPIMGLIGGLELVKVTARASDTLTIVRGQEGTTAGTWGVGTSFQTTLTAGQLADFWNALKWRTSSVMDFGAVGDGVTDDGPAFRNAVASGGHIIVPGGHTYLVAPTTNPTDATYSAAIFLPSNTWLDGDGNGVAEIKLASTAPNQSAICTNLHISQVGGNDSHIMVSNLTFNGNSTNQPATTDRNRGLMLHSCRDIRIVNVNSRNCLGQSGATGPNGTPGEGHHIVVYASTDVVIENCTVWSDDGGKTASGIGVGDCFNAKVKNCTAYNMQFGWGITTYDAASLDVEGCSVYACANGFFFELGTNVNVANCVSGGFTPFADSTYYPLGQGVPVGNTNYGFASRGSVGLRMTNCLSVYNGTGMLIQNEAPVPGPARAHASASLTNCRFVNNSSVGLYCNTVSDVVVADSFAEMNANSGFYVDGVISTVSSLIAFLGCVSRSNTNYGYEFHNAGLSANALVANSQAWNNTVHDIFENGAGGNLLGHKPTPTMPLSTVAYTSQFATPVVAYISGGTVTVITVNGTQTGTTSGPVYLKPGQQIAITYSASPSWQWFGV